MGDIIFFISVFSIVLIVMFYYLNVGKVEKKLDIIYEDECYMYDKFYAENRSEHNSDLIVSRIAEDIPYFKKINDKNENTFFLKKNNIEIWITSSSFSCEKYFNEHEFVKKHHYISRNYINRKEFSSRIEFYIILISDKDYKFSFVTTKNQTEMIEKSIDTTNKIKETEIINNFLNT